MTAVRLLFDEDADHRILRGLRRAAPQIDARSVIDVGLAGRPDREILICEASTAADWANRTDFLPL